jgi:hypothetical protein
LSEARRPVCRETRSPGSKTGKKGLPVDSPEIFWVADGDVIAYRLFDIAYAVDLGAAEENLRSRPGVGSARRRLSTPPKAVAFDVPPLAVTLDPVCLSVHGRAAQARVIARVYDFGVISLALTFPVRDVSWSGFSDLLNQVAHAIGAGSDRAIWAKLTNDIRSLLGAALDRPTLRELEEDYMIGLVRSFDRPLTAAEIPTTLDLVPLLSGESLPLSDAARQDLLRQQFSYYVDDLVVLTWDRAFIYEPRGDSDVIDVLEVANAQLLEMRYYDELLDDELPRIYDLVETTRRTTGLFASRRFAQLARRLYGLVAEVTELTEKADNALQVTEDVYLARIYATALELFRVRVVSAAVDRKLAIIRDTYTALYEEASSGRAALMELAIVVLILVEIALALLRH